MSDFTSSINSKKSDNIDTHTELKDKNGAVTEYENTSMGIEFAVNDGYQNSQSIQALVYVSDVDDSPVSEDDEFFVLVGQSISILPENGLLKNDTDIEGHLAEVSLVEYLGDGVLTLRPDGSFDYKPAENFYGKDSFTYRSIANGQLSNIALVEFEVGGPENTIVITEIL